MTHDIQHVLTVGNEIGEAPIWVPEESRLYWVNTEGSQIFRYRPSDYAFDSFTVSLPVTALLRRRGGGWVLVTKKGLAFWDQTSNTCEFIVDPTEGQDNLCFNDGAVDREGRIVAGTMNFINHINPDGRVYRLDGDLKLTELDSGLSVANGIGFSPDGKTMYVSEQFAGRILAYDYSKDDSLPSNKRVFATIPSEEGKPDGIIVDAEGYVWNGRWGGATIVRYSPDGKINRRYNLPIETATCMAFGGDNLDELYFTTAWYGLDANGRKANPYAGDLFVLRPGITGSVEPRFRG